MKSNSIYAIFFTLSLIFISYLFSLTTIRGSATLADPADMLYPGEVSYEDLDDCYAVEISGDYLFLGVNDSVKIYLISDVKQFEEIATYYARGRVYDLEVAGNLLYVCGSLGGLEVVDIEDPSLPTLLDYWSSSQECMAVDVEGNTAFCAWGLDGINVLDTYEPDQLFLMDALTLGSYTHDLEVIGDIAYMAAGTNLRLINISDPWNLNIISSILVTDVAQDVAIDGNVLYLADRNEGLRVFNITDKKNPYELSFLSLNGSSWDIELWGDIAYVASLQHGIHLVNISNPNSITEFNVPRSDAHLGMFPREMKLHGDHLFIADSVYGLRIVKISEMVNIEKVSDARKSGCKYTKIAISNNILYALDENFGLEMYNFSNPNDISYMTNTFIFGSLIDMEIVGDIAFITDTDGTLFIFNVSDPYNVYQITSVAVGGNLYDIEIEGDLAYICDGNDGLNVVDIAYLDMPTSMGNFTPVPSIYIWDSDIEGDIAYIAHDSYGFVIANITDPFNAFEMSCVSDIGIVTEVNVEGEYAYVANSTGGLTVINVMDSYNPYIVAHEDTSPINEICISGNCMVLAEEAFHIGAYNITDPSNPELLSSKITSNSSLDALIWQNMVLASIDDFGIEVESIRTYGTEDVDGDSLNFWQEVWGYGTDPLLIDTDFDNLDDNEELNYDTDPRNPDSDGDGISDGDEVAAGTDPNTPQDGDDDGFNGTMFAPLIGGVVIVIFLVIIIKGIRGKKKSKLIGKSKQEPKFG
ncbi:MAG: hypothetical protein GF364_15945 [Candidatus Lokiarchaeota archaeon]|nr:hypothetical protein [Candidatus Lokiarchaeota archaeon]